MPNAYVPQRYTILRQVENSSKLRIELAQRPLQVWTLMDEEAFLKWGLVHNMSAFIEDSLHDWNYQDGKLRFYGHSSAPCDKVDLVLVWQPSLHKQWEAVQSQSKDLKLESWYQERLAGRKHIRAQTISLEIARELIQAQQDEIGQLRKSAQQA